jgi:xanthine/CO dehydrogenase XdhC/CoxF family maturation factor
MESKRLTFGDEVIELLKERRNVNYDTVSDERNAFRVDQTCKGECSVFLFRVLLLK